jgi:hypothetical protein
MGVGLARADVIGFPWILPSDWTLDELKRLDDILEESGGGLHFQRDDVSTIPEALIYLRATQQNVTCNGTYIYPHQWDHAPDEGLSKDDFYDQPDYWIRLGWRIEPLRGLSLADINTYGEKLITTLGQFYHRPDLPDDIYYHMMLIGALPIQWYHLEYFSY